MKKISSNAQNSKRAKQNSKRAKNHRHDTKIKEDLIFGIDLGIASVGWAVLKEKAKKSENQDEIAFDIKAMGSWCFELPERSDTKEPLNFKRRAARLSRRVTRRRSRRMNAIRKLFYDHQLLPNDDKNILREVGARLRQDDEHDKNPWALRVAGLNKKLEKEEFAIALAHIAKHRGVSFSIKNAAEEQDKKQSEYKKSIKREGHSYAINRIDKEQKRNRHGQYIATPHRDLLRKEVAHIFAKQRELGNDWASEDLQKAYEKDAFSQKPLQDSDHLVGFCTFEPKEKRAAKYAPSFEKFRLLQTLCNLQIQQIEKNEEIPKGKRLSFIDYLKEKALNQEITSIKDIFSSIIDDIGKEEKFTAGQLREKSGLEKDFVFFSNAKKVTEIASFKGSCALYQVLGKKIWTALGYEILDKIAFLITHKASEETLKKGLKKALEKLEIQQELKKEVIEIILEEMKKEKGCRFLHFKAVAHLSSKALGKIIPHFMEGITYDKACERAGYDHTQIALDKFKQLESKQDFNTLVKEINKEITNPVVRKSFTEGLKQLWAMRVRYGVPGKICVELARDVGKSARERGEIEKSNNKREGERKKEREAVAKILNKNSDAVTTKELLRYRLWKEQNGFCLYTGKPIPPQSLGEKDALEIDHIIPYSRSWDDSFNNKVLVLKAANQNKSNLTALEWFERTKSQEEIKVFKETIRTSHVSSFKKERLLFSRDNKDGVDYEDKLKERYLNDTRYATRIFARAASFLYDENNRGKIKGSKRRVFARPGGVTASLRHIWGVENLKKNEQKERLNDSRHHALDALIVACCDEALLQKITKSFQENEKKGYRAFKGIEEPWEGFRKDLNGQYEQIITARPENHRARGKAHEESIKSAVCHEKGIEIFKRVKVTKLKKGDLPKIKDKDRNKHIIKVLEAWFDKGSPEKNEADLPRLIHKDKKTGKTRTDIIRNITIRDNTDGGVYLPQDKEPVLGERKGIAERGSMTRVDIYSQVNKGKENKGKEDKDKVNKGKEDKDKENKDKEDKDKKSYYCVPIYSYQIMNKGKYPIPPMRAIATHKDEKDWKKIDKNFSFEFSIYPGSYLKIQKKEKPIEEGYYLSIDRGTGSMIIRKVNASQKKDNFTAGAQKLWLFEKYQINRFGEKFPVKENKITWHGQSKTLQEWVDEAEKHKNPYLKEQE